MIAALGSEIVLSGLRLVSYGVGCGYSNVGDRVLLVSSSSGFISAGAEIVIPGTDRRCSVWESSDRLSWVDVSQDPVTDETILDTIHVITVSSGCGSLSSYSRQMLARYRSSIGVGSELIDPNTGNSCTILSVAYR